MTLLSRKDAPDAHPVSDMETLYEQYRNYIYKIAYNILHSPEDAEDILEEVMVNILRHRDRFIGAEKKAIESQIVIYTRNAAFNLYRKNKRREKAELDDGFPENLSDGFRPMPDGEENPYSERASPERSPEETLLSREASQIVKRYIERLSPEYRDTLLLVYSHGYSNIEAADILHISPNAVALRLHKAKKKLLAMAGEELHEIY